ncbi:MAG: AMIN domain-containing protein, partial [Deltaproteobacteria bacterium]|nr:AMIN domain-containing protein [Deltaproteobacteria bacterium]
MKKRGFLIAFIFIIFLTLGITIASGAIAAYRLLEVRHWSAPDHTRVVIDLSGPPTYNIPSSENPLSLVLNLQGIFLQNEKKEIPVNDPVIRKMMVNPKGKDLAEVTLFLVKPARWKVFSLKPYQDKPHRLVVDIFR